MVKKLVNEMSYGKRSKSPSHELIVDFNFELGSLLVFFGNFFNFFRFSFFTTPPPLFSTACRMILEKRNSKTMKINWMLKLKRENGWNGIECFVCMSFRTTSLIQKHVMISLKFHNTNVQICKNLWCNLQHHYSTDITQCVPYLYVIQ